MKNKIIICMGSSCFARGNDQNLAVIENYIRKNRLDVTVELSGSRCNGKCAIGPNIILNDKEYNNVTAEKLEKICKEFKK